MEPLCAGGDGRRDLVVFRGRQNEYRVPGRLLEYFKQCIECIFAQLMHLIDDEYLIGIGRWREKRAFFETANVIDAAGGCGIDLDDVHGIAAIDLDARRTGIARFSKLFECGVGKTLLAVGYLGDEPCGGCLAASASAIKKIGMAKSVRFCGVFYDADDGFLTQDILEPLGAIFSVKG